MEKTGRWMIGRIVMFVLFGLLLAGSCASDKKPTEKLANADLAVQRAREANAINYAPLELRMAEDKLEESINWLSEFQGETLEEEN